MRGVSEKKYKKGERGGVDKGREREEGGGGKDSAPAVSCRSMAHDAAVAATSTTSCGETESVRACVRACVREREEEGDGEGEGEGESDKGRNGESREGRGGAGGRRHQHELHLERERKSGGRTGERLGVWGVLLRSERAREELERGQARSGGEESGMVGRR
jgi:hypothetical protein